jgi:hypothetical protein
MRDLELQPVTAAEASPGTSLGAALLALNNAHAQELSWLEPARLRHLVEQAFLARRIGELDAFLLAFDQSARYDSPNFLWFRSRYPRFVYVDRIVVAASARGRPCPAALRRSVQTRCRSAPRVRRLRSQHAAAKSGVGYVSRRFGVCRSRQRERV